MPRPWASGGCAGPLGSAVLKISSPPVDGHVGFWPTSDDPSHWNYWRREALAYTSGLTATAYAGTGITTADLLESTVRPDGLVEFWLADVSGTDGFSWSVPRIARFAYELGTGQARWVGRVPGTDWLSRQWLAQYLVEGPSLSVRIQDNFWDHPRVTGWRASVRERRLGWLWPNRERISRRRAGRSAYALPSRCLASESSGQ